MFTNNTELEIEDSITVDVNGSEVKIKGPKGESSKDFGMGVELKLDGKKIKISTKEKAMLNTVKGLITNIIHGTKEGFTKKMMIRYAHFPMTIEVKGKEIIIKNFIGEKHPRKAKIKGEVKVVVKGQELTLTGINKDDVGQTAANIRAATKIRKKDSRIFQDGIYPIGE